jgi:hypothetical protein
MQKKSEKSLLLGIFHDKMKQREKIDEEFREKLIRKYPQAL